MTRFDSRGREIFKKFLTDERRGIFLQYKTMKMCWVVQSNGEVIVRPPWNEMSEGDLLSAEPAGSLGLRGVLLLFSQLGEGGDGAGDLLWDGGRGGEMGAGGVEAGLVGVPLGDDGGAVRGGVGVLALGGLGLEVFLAGVLQGALLLH